MNYIHFLVKKYQHLHQHIPVPELYQPQRRYCSIAVWIYCISCYCCSYMKVRIWWEAWNHYGPWRLFLISRTLSLSILHTQTYVDIISVIWFKIVLNESYGINIIKILISTVNASPWLNDHNLSTLKTCCIKLKWDPHHHNIKVRGKRSMANPNQLQQKRQKKHGKILNPNQLQQKMQFFPPRLGRINSVMYRSSTIAL